VLIRATTVLIVLGLLVAIIVSIAIESRWEF